jgi:lipopolysaccharide transport system permease protein
MKPLRVTVYEPGSPLKHPKRFILGMFVQLHSARELAWRLTIRDFKVLYRNSFAGYLWAFLPPLVASFTFILLRQGGAVNVSDTGGIPYAAFTLTGTILWQVFVDAMMNPLKTMTSCRSMLTKINFPYEALILSPVQMSLINLAIRLLILVPCMIWFQFPIGWSLLLVPVGLIMLVLLGACFGLLLAPLSGLYKDVQMGLAMITTFWMFLTPVVFPNIREGLLGTFMKINPVTYVLGATRDWLTGVANTPYLTGFYIVTLCVIITLIASVILFRILLGRVIERMGM